MAVAGSDQPPPAAARARQADPALVDTQHMLSALALARRGLGSTWPNPSVGCVIVRDGRVVGRGTTAPGGRPHAEVVALAMAGDQAKAATAYVTLEPCCHFGASPPCTDALIGAGISRVVVAATDPDDRVNGRGLEQLRTAGIAVETGLLQADALDTLIGFDRRIRLGRPMLTLKLASTLDGRIATHGGESQWITETPARRLGHAMRGRHDAVMVGVGTVLADNPDLTCRIPGFRPTPNVRVITDSHLRTSLTSRLLTTAATVPTWFLLREGTNLAREDAFVDLGAKLIKIPGSSVGVDLTAAMTALGSAGLTRVLVEGGAKLAAALLRADLVDRIAWFHAPAVMGGDGWPAVQAFGIQALDRMPRFRRDCITVIGNDMLSEYARQPSCSPAS
ncbi:bifunctional diaminohydroxyphosphoribosylaminopyrimidine deaminase/5-amino-6-(5-phosphoribosylamino)uracil reductase RibD [Rhodopila sp.]|uniref:bifunctional diaminohydroxyphosphoribosylaminopyrimidine deaminase/5-amino-6-(5-phosphoribosylamino)uracil reductase RibD n=1 Tax=Rhodopila sp. TaxID=2480087 RepID=UPI003D0F0CFB